MSDLTIEKVRGWAKSDIHYSDFRVDYIRFLLAEIDRLVSKYERGPQRCNKGHETLPLKLWDCPSCTEELQARVKELEEALRRCAEMTDREKIVERLREVRNTDGSFQAIEAELVGCVESLVAEAEQRGFAAALAEAVIAVQGAEAVGKADVEFCLVEVAVARIQSLTLSDGTKALEELLRRENDKGYEEAVRLSGSIPRQQVHEAVAFLEREKAKARLEEGKWWRRNYCDPAFDKSGDRRISELEKAVSEAEGRE